MKRILFALLILGIAGLAACDKNEQKNETAKTEANVPAGVHAVKVIEHMNASNYTYMQVSENGKEYWIAAPQIEVKNGETVYFARSMEMKNFESKTLNRKFDTILFVENASTTPPAASGQGMQLQHPKLKQTPEEDVKIAHLKDGKTVAQIYEQKNALAGKIVKVRGKVAKYNPSIMDRNWIHIQDGTKAAGGFDLMVTSQDQAAVGDIVVVQGTVAVDKDFGAGYKYPVMLENAKVKIESKSKGTTL